MKDGPDISRVAALVGDPARSNMLLALMDGRALTAGELASLSGVTKQTASSHLARLLDGGLVAREVQGRHHYYRLGGADVALALETLLCVSERRNGSRTRTGPRDPDLRRARICYDHLAGELGVLVYDRMISGGLIVDEGSKLTVTPAGWAALDRIDIRPDEIPASRRPLCRTCLDWSMRRHHLAGRLGGQILKTILLKGWVRRVPDSRIIRFSSSGERALMAWLPPQPSPGRNSSGGRVPGRAG